MLLLTSRISESLELGFHVEGFWTAVVGGIVVSLSTMVLDMLLPEPR
jgi:putative membrane protein